MKSILDVLLGRQKHVCPNWLCFSLDNFIRKKLHDPTKILTQHIKKDYFVLDVGSGPGYFSIPIAKMVGENGKLIAIDIQKGMLQQLEKKAYQNEVADRVVCQLITNEDFKVNVPIDFVIAFWMIHEVPDKQIFMRSIYNAMKTGTTFLIAEPYLHVTGEMFDKSVAIAESIGFKIIDKPKIFFSRTVLLRK